MSRICVTAVVTTSHPELKHSRIKALPLCVAYRERTS